MELTFEKWEDGRWFVILPEYDGDQEDLEMVDGADLFLDYLMEDGLYVTVDVSLEDTGDYPIMLKLVAHDVIGGTYQVENLEGWTGAYMPSVHDLPSALTNNANVKPSIN